MNNEDRLRAEIIATAQDMSASGLSSGRSGNLSVRVDGGMLITPSGVAYGEMTMGDIVFVTEEGSYKGALKPSSEWQFHLAAYQERDDIHAHVHAHALNATVLACAHKPIPAFHYMVAAAGGKDIPLVDYATFGTKELSENVARGLSERNACLIANHGLCAVGKNLSNAYELAHEVETLAAQYVKVLMLGAVHLLDEDEMNRVFELFKSYGQSAQT